MTLLDAFSLLGGVGLFLYGMTIMSEGLKDAAGDNLQTILEKATSNKFTAIFVGTLMTVLIQSSSATDIMVIGFVNSGMMNLFQALGVIMGANIGTTVTAQITAFNLAAYAPVIMFFGVVAFLFVKNNTVKYVGEVIMGFGMLFVGISIMKTAIKPLSESEAFIRTISGLDNPFAAVLFGVAFTALLQSSSSSTVIFQAFAVQGLLSYRTAVYLVIGAAIGSVTPNLIASLTVNRNGKRSAILNLVFNLFRAALMMTLVALFPQILTWIQALSPNDIGRQIANTHTHHLRDYRGSCRDAVHEIPREDCGESHSDSAGGRRADEGSYAPVHGEYHQDAYRYRTASGSSRGISDGQNCGEEPA